MQERRSHSFTDAELNDIMDLLAAKRLRVIAHQRQLLDNEELAIVDACLTRQQQHSSVISDSAA